MAEIAPRGGGDDRLAGSYAPGPMDWKRFYAEELALPSGHRAVLDAVERHAPGDAAIAGALVAGALASFPHVTLRDSADPIARLAQSILETGKEHVLALGVLHGGTMPKVYREGWSALQCGLPEAEKVFPRFAGAFFSHGDATTPFGPIEEGPLPPPTEFMREDAALLAGEFSLDLFAALLAAAAQVRGVRPPALSRLFVCATRSPRGDFAVAQAVASEMRAVIGSGTVCVATGDLAHVGHGYSSAGEAAGLPDDPGTLEASVRAGIVEQYEAALGRHDFPTAWAIGTRWLNDQRHMLPVIAELARPKATFDLLSLKLSDYADINGMPPPCFVASALGLCRPARSGSAGKQPA